MSPLTASQFLQYMYDAENRLTRVHGWGFIMDMTYDYRHRRVEQTYTRWDGNAWVVESKRRFVYDGFQIIAEIDATQATLPVTSTYFWGYDTSHTLGGAGGIGGLLLIDDHPHNERYLPGYDANGNVVLLVRESDGQLDAKFEYDPYGNLLRAEGDAVDKTPFRYQTKWDLDYGADAADSWFSWGLVDYGLRFYQPTHGRFLNRDPIGGSRGPQPLRSLRERSDQPAGFAGVEQFRG